MTPFEKLKNKLAELFQLDQADLDFGIYRIMNARRDEINQFLEKDLLPQVQSAFEIYKSSDKDELQKELDRVTEGVKAAGMNPQDSPKVNELKEKLAEYGVDTKGMENDVYDHLYSFFSRYYHEGDFISLRRYKEGVYAIPYEGEEVKLHWANHDQYYIKTSEYFKDYTFAIPRVGKTHFKIIEADTEKDNVKSTDEKDRRFVLSEEEPICQSNGELIIRVEYRADRQKRKQDAINSETVRKVLENLNNKDFAMWFKALSEKWKNARGESSEKTILEKHLTDYTKRNTFDYFIHKDLEGFLKRELDFYIKNEVMRLDDIENESSARVEQYLSKIKVIRRIAHKIIAFIAQIEEFQKKLWQKKKFVVQTNYCITLDRVPEELYPEIIANKAQHDEWVRIFSIDEIEGDMVTPKYSNPLSIEFLKSNDNLLLDTRFFSKDFSNKMLSAVENLDQSCDGVLINSENYQALELISSSYKEGVDCIYIDPPYNTSENAFLYKNLYKHSSWLSLLSNTMTLAPSILKNSGIILSAIDDTEYSGLKTLLSECFGADNYAGTIAIEVNPAGQNIRPNVPARSHDYLHMYAKCIDDVNMHLRKLTEKEIEQYKELDDQGRYYWDNLRRRGGNSRPGDRPKQWFPLYVRGVDVRVPDMCWNESEQIWDVLEKPKEGETIAWPIDPKGEKRIWRVNPDGARKNIKSGEISVIEKAGRQEVSKKSREPEGKKPKTLWHDSKYSATSHGTKLLIDILGTGNNFSYPKSIHLTTDSIRYWLGDTGLTVDYFAGSGTTGHAVINLNREDGGKRKYSLVEMGTYFDTVTKPRIQKVIYSKEWKNGKPVGRNGISQMFKYLKLESYEDSLANIHLNRDEAQQTLLNNGSEFQESYLLNYMLDVESKGSLMNINQFDDPWNYKLLVGQGSVGETKPVNVDLIETFNWLIGLKVKHIDVISGYTVIEGTNPSSDNVLIIWRKIRDLSESDPEAIAKLRDRANTELEAFFKKQQYNTLDSEYDIIYVNGDNNLMNVPLNPDKKTIEPRYKVRLIEEEFQKLMFETRD